MTTCPKCGHEWSDEPDEPEEACDILMKDGKAIVALPAGWEFSARELAEFRVEKNIMTKRSASADDLALAVAKRAE
jgi:hypothetical protein